MQLIADLHLHSKYSRAVSPQMVIPEIARWAKKKGIDLVATADWTHPLWLRELKENLVEAGEGIFHFKSEPQNIFFLLVTEISSIYSQAGKGRRIHNLVFAPSFKIVEKINAALIRRGANLISDGRPIIDLTSRELAELVFSVSKKCLIIPAHLWTPWYGLYGSKSGFDSIKECFGEFTPQIRAIETGLSSSPDMNWRIAELDSRTILSFSDAHSLPKLGREATVFELADSLAGKVKHLSYQVIKKAIVNQEIAYTIEFYPQEGKYHFTGHRKCQVCHSPAQTKKLGTTCPVCGRPLTVGVMQRVEELATRPEGYQPGNRPPYKMLVPLAEIIAEALGVGVSTQAVQGIYTRLIGEFGSEFKVLLEESTNKIAKISSEKVAEGVSRVRSGDLVIDPGYDGVFGTVKIWPASAEASVGKPPQKQMSLF